MSADDHPQPAVNPWRVEAERLMAIRDKYGEPADLHADAERGRALVHHMFTLTRPSPAWEQALAELRAWSMRDWEPRS